MDDGTLATYDGRTVHLWHVAGAGPATEALHTGTLRSSARVAAAGFSADGRYIVTGSRSIRVFDASSAGARSVLRIEEPVNPSDKQPLIHGGVLTWVEFSPDPASHRFASSGLDGSAKIWDWDPANQRPVAARDLAHTPDVAVRQVRWSPDASLVVTAGDDGQVRVWDVADAQAPPTVMPLPDPDGAYRFLCCAFSPECEVLGATRWVAAGGIDLKRQSSVVVVWKLTDQGPRLHCVVPGKEHGNRGVTAVAFTPDGRLVTGGVRGALMMWEFLRPRVAADESPPQARPLFPIVRFGSRGRSTAHRGQVTSIAVAADGTMATSAADGALVWGF